MLVLHVLLTHKWFLQFDILLLLLSKLSKSPDLNMEPRPFHLNIVPYSQCKDIQALQKDKTTSNVSRIAYANLLEFQLLIQYKLYWWKSKHSLFMEQLILRILLLKATSFAGIYFKAEIKILIFFVFLNHLQKSRNKMNGSILLGFCRTWAEQIGQRPFDAILPQFLWTMRLFICYMNTVSALP